MASAAHALELPAAPEGPINDYAHLLSNDAIGRLDAQLRSYELGTTRQIAVAIFPSLEDESLEDVSLRLAEKWKIGSKKNSDGVLITIFLKEHRDRIDVGYGLEGQLTDALAGRIQRDLMEPKFKAGDFEGGLRAGIAAIDTATGGHAHDEGKLPAAGAQRHDDGVPWFLIIGVAIFVILWIRSRFGGGGRGGGGGGGGFWSGLFLGSAMNGWTSSSSGWSSHSGGWGGGGGGGWWGGWGGGGGGGWSGGGGSFGGGGSSGSW